MRILILTAFLLLGCRVGLESSASNPNPIGEHKDTSLTTDLEHFRYHGKPIHPAVVEILETPLADPLGTIVSVDLEGALRSNRVASSECVHNHDFLECELKNSDREYAGFFEYRHLGCTPGGLHVVETVSNGGGSGMFGNLLMLTFDQDMVTEQGIPRRRVLMKLIGSFALGDRDDGEVYLEGSRLVISASRYRPEKTMIVLP